MRCIAKKAASALRGGAVLVVSPFTLAAATHKGNRPPFGTGPRPGMSRLSSGSMTVLRPFFPIRRRGKHDEA